MDASTSIALQFAVGWFDGRMQPFDSSQHRYCFLAPPPLVPLGAGRCGVGWSADTGCVGAHVAAAAAAAAAAKNSG